MSTRKSQRHDRSASINRTRRPQSKITRKDGVGGIVVGTGISFTNPGTIADSGNQLALFPVGCAIQVRGSAKNSRRFNVTASAAGSLTVTPATVTSEGAGPTITITREE